MRTHREPETEKWFTGGKRGSRGSVLCSLRFLLFTIPVACSAAQAQEAIEAWVQQYDGTGNGTHYPKAMALDTNGHVYVTGNSRDASASSSQAWVTIAYSGAGVPLWTNRYNEPDTWSGAIDVVVDTKGNVILTGSCPAGDFFTTVKHSNAGVPLWTNWYRPPGSISCCPVAMAVDRNENVFVTGVSYSGSGEDYLTVKYSSAGALLWARSYNGPGNGRDFVQALAIDANGDVFVTGSSRGIDTFVDDYLTLKYSNAGDLLWTRLYNGPGGWMGPGKGEDDATALAVDAEGSVIVTGMSDGGTNILSCATIKYSSAGEPLWTNRYDGGGATAVAVDPNGNVLVTGGGTGGDYLTLKYSSAGVPLWTNHHHQSGNYVDQAIALALDPGGNVIVTGSSLNLDLSQDARHSDFLTVAYSSDGILLWTKRYNGPNSSDDQPCAVAADAGGSVYVAGQSYKDPNTDYVTIKYVIPPIITRQPLSCTNAAGSTACFTVEAVGGTPLSYQWRRDGTNLVDGGRLSGVTSTNLLVSDVQLTDQRGYTAMVTNEWGSATSVVAHLTVTIPPSAGRFTNFKFSAETGFSFIFRDGTVGQPYRIQRSSSMAAGSWANWQSFTYSEPLALTDLGAVSIERRFYRAVSP